MDYGSAADRYLCKRIVECFQVYRFLRGGFGRWLSNRSARPALMAGACVYPSQHVVAVQVAPLTKDGEMAWSKPAQLTFGHPVGAAVQIWPWRQGYRVNLTASVEYAYAFGGMCPGEAIWAALDPGHLAQVQLPHGASVTLHLGDREADRDALLAAAATLRSKGHEVTVEQTPSSIS
jgi:hypothetical protein